MRGKYEYLAEDHWRWVIEGSIRVQNLSLSLYANMGDSDDAGDDDDVRVFITQKYEISKLAEALR